MWMANALREKGVTARPVVHLDDEPAVLEAAAAVHDQHGAGIVVRLGSEEQDPAAKDCDHELPKLLATTGLAREEVDLLVDLRSVDSPKTVIRVVDIAAAVVRWVADDGPWRSITVASGAFPSSISNLPRGEQTALRRFDADLSVALTNVPIRPTFGDYGVTNPSMPASVPRGPLPNLRYTHDEEWWVWREATVLPGNESMRTLCDRVVQSAAWPATGAGYSWGDSEIARLSRNEGGAGTATQWRAWGTSHHLAVVTDRLTTLNVP